MYSNLQDGKMMTPIEMIDVLKAYEEGKEIEIYDGRAWIKCNPPLWNFALFNYRVKQKEKEVYQYLYSDGGHPPTYRATTGFYETIEEAQSHLASHCHAIRRLDRTKTIIKE